MSGPYTVQLLRPDGAVVESTVCSRLSEVARIMVGYGDVTDALLDERGEVTLSLSGPDGRKLTDDEHGTLMTLFEEWGGTVPRDDDEAQLFRDHNPRLRRDDQS